jgi:hypothetical protein
MLWRWLPILWLPAPRCVLIHSSRNPHPEPALAKGFEILDPRGSDQQLPGWRRFRRGAAAREFHQPEGQLGYLIVRHIHRD